MVCLRERESPAFARRACRRADRTATRRARAATRRSAASRPRARRREFPSSGSQATRARQRQTERMAQLARRAVLAVRHDVGHQQHVVAFREHDLPFELQAVGQLDAELEEVAFLVALPTQLLPRADRADGLAVADGFHGPLPGQESPPADRRLDLGAARRQRRPSAAAPTSTNRWRARPGTTTPIRATRRADSWRSNFSGRGTIGFRDRPPRRPRRPPCRRPVRVRLREDRLELGSPSLRSPSLSSKRPSASTSRIMSPHEPLILVSRRRATKRRDGAFANRAGTASNRPTAVRAPGASRACGKPSPSVSATRPSESACRAGWRSERIGCSSGNK